MKNLILLLTFSVSFNSFAFDYNEQAKNIFDKAKGAVGKVIDAANSLPRPSLPAPAAEKRLATNNSRYLVSDTVSNNAQWVMIQVTKSGETKADVVAVTPAKNGRFSETISLRLGAGIYEIGIFENATAEKYTSYSSVKSFTVENLDQRDTTDLLASQYVQSDDSEILSLAQMITEGSTDETEAIKRIHDFITENIKYDYDSFNDGSYVSKPFDALTVLETKKTVCAGYSNLLAALARAVGIRAKVIYGKATFNGGWADHAWNEIMINGEWKVIDSTWDAANPKAYKYFFPTAESFAHDHQGGTEQTIM